MINKRKLAGLLSVLMLAAMPVMGAEAESYMIDDMKEITFVVTPNLFICPLQEQTIMLSPFCDDRAAYFHEGIDLKAEEGTPVYAVADGFVTKAAPDSKGVDQGGGEMIFIDHGNGIESRYMHLSGYDVSTGDTVKMGQLIGYTGNTGDSSTPHLHYEYRVNGVPNDPTFIFTESGCITLDQQVAVVQNEENMDGFYIEQQ